MEKKLQAYDELMIKLKEAEHNLPAEVHLEMNNLEEIKQDE